MNMDTWSRRIGIRTEDRRKLWLMAPVFLICGVAEALNYNGFMTLFNLRFGSEFLPYVYAAEAVILPLEAWFMSWLAGKLSKPSLMRAMYYIMTGVVAINAAALLVMRATGEDWRFYYPVLFLTSSFVVRQQTILLWSLAVDVCPTQQAKRLMPIFIAAATMGGVIAGLLTQVVNSWYGPDIVYAIGPVLLAAAVFNYRKAIARYLVPLTLRAAAGGPNAGSAEDGGSSALDYFRRTLRSPFLLGVLGMMTIMPSLYFLMEYVFLNTSHAAYPNEADFGRMFGVVTTVLFALAFLLQLVSGRLMAWLGASGMLTAIAGVYVVSFAAALFFLDSPAAVAAVSGGYMLTYLLLYYTAEPSYQLFYKTLPLAQRDGFRYVAQGISSCGGILLGAGLQLLHNGFGLGFAALAAVGAAGAAALLALSWFVRQLYMRELVKSIQVLGLAERELAESFREFARNSKTMGTVLAMLRSPTSGEEAKEIALDIIGRTKDVRYLPELLPLIDDANDRIKIAALKALNLAGADLHAMARVASLLEDPEPDVRTEAVRKLAGMKHMPSQAFFFLRMKLLDSHPGVVAEAVKAMYSLESAQSYEACFEVIEKILKEGGEPAVYVCRVVAELRLERFSPEVAKLLDDPSPSVRVAATACLGSLQATQVLSTLLERLRTADQELYRVTEQALSDMGSKAVAALKASLPNAAPKVWKASVAALSKLLPDDDVRGWLAEQGTLKLAENDEAMRLPAAFRQLGRTDLAELAELRVRDLRETVHGGIWAMLERLTDEQVVAAIRRAVDDQDEEIRGGGLEVLAEGVGERRLSQRLAATLQAEESVAIVLSDQEAEEAAHKAATSADDWWREMAAELNRSKTGGIAVLEEQGMLGRLNKVVFLKKVAFFADLSLEELGLIASVATEEKFSDGDLLLKRGEKNASLYVIVEGNVELTSVSAAGWEGTIGVVGPGEVCGANSALDESPSAVTAQAFFGDVRVLGLQRDEVTRLVRLYPEIGIGLLRASLARIRLLEEMIMRIDS
ncbi:HEAT repeat domain-containing protein [Cohnella faecalis]|nr:HEAT repeat domain-containing protein [Cohnella faecalis]